MAQYLLSVWHDDQNFPQTTPEDMERMFAQVGAFDEEVGAAGFARSTTRSWPP